MSLLKVVAFLFILFSIYTITSLVYHYKLINQYEFLSLAQFFKQELLLKERSYDEILESYKKEDWKYYVWENHEEIIQTFIDKDGAKFEKKWIIFVPKNVTASWSEVTIPLPENEIERLYMLKNINNDPLLIPVIK